MLVVVVTVQSRNVLSLVYSLRSVQRQMYQLLFSLHLVQRQMYYLLLSLLLVQRYMYYLLLSLCLVQRQMYFISCLVFVQSRDRLLSLVQSLFSPDRHTISCLVQRQMYHLLFSLHLFQRQMYYLLLLSSFIPERYSLLLRSSFSPQIDVISLVTVFVQSRGVLSPLSESSKQHNRHDPVCVSNTATITQSFQLSPNKMATKEIKLSA